MQVASGVFRLTQGVSNFYLVEESDALTLVDAGAAGDWDLLLRFIQAGARFRRVPYFLACFRVHSKQKTHMLLDLVAAQTSRMVEEGREPRPRQRYVVWGNVPR